MLNVARVILTSEQLMYGFVPDFRGSKENRVPISDESITKIKGEYWTTLWIVRTTRRTSVDEMREKKSNVYARTSFLFLAAVQPRFGYPESDMHSLWNQVLRPSLVQTILDSRKSEKKRHSAPATTTSNADSNANVSSQSQRCSPEWTVSSLHDTPVCCLWSVIYPWWRENKTSHRSSRYVSGIDSPRNEDNHLSIVCFRYVIIQELLFVLGRLISAASNNPRWIVREHEVQLRQDFFIWFLNCLSTREMLPQCTNKNKLSMDSLFWFRYSSPLRVERNKKTSDAHLPV